MNQRFSKSALNKIDKTDSIVKILVSATPFDSLAHILHTNSSRKFEKVLYPARTELSGYLGFKEMLVAGKIVDHKDFNLKKRITEMRQHEFAIVRFHGKEYAKQFADLTHKFGLTHDIREHTQSSKIENFYEASQEVFTRPTIFFVKQNLRQGDRLDNTNLSFTYESPSMLAALDTVAQSLIGRGCGFGKSNNTVHCTNLDAIKEYIKMWEHLHSTGEIKLPENMCLSKRSEIRSEDTKGVIYAQVTYIPQGYKGLGKGVRDQLTDTEILIPSRGAKDKLPAEVALLIIKMVVKYKWQLNTTTEKTM